ncbi:hypothetical protein [Metabacillus niabensis]|uniref:hypothetical protein n=1 Tax=Metabacillus niabensis TaxID=324854 RepID=UPI001CFB3CFF|nr:hypothetical protein [Metabacillus niabensis]
MKQNNLLKLQEMVKEHEHKTINYLNEIKKLINESKKDNNDVQLISYFTYSVNISHRLDDENLIIGSYIIHNIGQKQITNPYICLQFTQSHPFQLSGKIISAKQQNSNITDGWERLNKSSDKDVYFLKPINKNNINPSQMISFQNFQLKWLPSKSYTGNILGYCYSDEFKEGIPAINSISISGNS